MRLYGIYSNKFVDYQILVPLKVVEPVQIVYVVNLWFLIEKVCNLINFYYKKFSN